MTKEPGPRDNPPTYDPSSDMLEKMHADDAALSEKDAERFDEDQRASALATAQAYVKKHGEVDQLVVGRVIPAPGHPSPHAARDKTEEYDMRKAPDHPVSMDDARFDPVPPPTLMTVKDTNPKDAVGTKKWRQYCTVPTTIIWELGVAMLEGARKYGRHNYRVAGVRASVYIDAAKGHIDQWWEGEDIDEESKLNHIIKAIASLAVLRDAMIQNKWVDDRPPKTDLPKLRAELQYAVDGIFERIPKAKDAYLEGDQHNDV